MNIKGLAVGGICAGLALAPALSSARTQGEQVCDILDGLAETAMLSRQAGVPMIEAYRNTDKLDPAASKSAKIIIEAAYRVPRREGQRDQTMAVSDFRTEIFKGCLASQDGE